MPRRRTIACEHCGYLQLKRDLTCDACGRMTRREKRRWAVIAIQAAVLLLVGLYVYAKIGGLSPP